ncbi:hypothetical protein [Borrelia hispanica]|uniref:hypothetical protein n=1 Tax=Borrelia hispanica TaxID=40835 RepID=UPI000463E944|nr:hypothetical protein [Borrelia hispanica]
MNKNKSILILCFTLFLYGCNSNKHLAKLNNEPIKTITDEQHPTPEKPTIIPTDEKEEQKSNRKPQDQPKPELTTEEKTKFKTLIHALEIYKKDNLLLHERFKYKISQGLQNILNKYNIFHTWILDNAQTQQQKELSKAFNYAYKLIYNKLQSLKNNMTMMQYIEGAFYNYLYDKYKNNNQYDGRLYGNTYADSDNNYVSSFFNDLIHIAFDKYDTNEKIFQVMKNELENKNSHTYKDTLNKLTD